MIKNLIKKNFPLACIAYVLLDLKVYFFYNLFYRIETTSGTAHASLSIDESISYIENVFSIYKTYSGIPNFYGKIAEIGPGDSCGVGLLILNDGASHVDLVDRFYSKRDVNYERDICDKLINKYPKLKSLSLNGEIPNKVKWHYGKNASAEIFFINNKPYDFIISCAVMEHLYDPIIALKRMAEALAPNGMLIHIVDLRDHGMFSTNFHELKFMEIPKLIYKRMTFASGRPNRVLINSYREQLELMGFQYKFLITSLAGVGPISPHVEYTEIPIEYRNKSIEYIKSVRSKFCKDLRSVPIEDLSVSGFVLIAKKYNSNKEHCINE